MKNVSIKVKNVEETSTRITQSFCVTVDDFTDVKFPTYLEVRGSYSDYFGWYEYSGYNITNTPQCEQYYGGSIVHVCEVSTAEEIVEILEGYENINYNYEEEEVYDLLIEGSGFSKMMNIIYTYYSSFDEENSYVTWEKSQGGATAAQQQEYLIELLSSNKIEELEINEWAKELASDAIKEQIEYLAQFI